MGVKSQNPASEALRKAAIYVRVSTTYQADRDSLPMQKRDLEAYSELILGIPDYEVFEDAGYSGKNTDRPAYQAMMARLRKGEFSHLLVWKIDRISRNLLDFSEMYLELKRLRVVFVSKHEQFDTSTAIGEAMLKIILVFAELERNMTAERVTATMISRAGQGLWNGGRIPYGYDYDPETGEFSIREDEAFVCRMIAEDYLKHRSLVHTARLLNSKGITSREGAEWSTNTVWIIVQSPFYAGTYRYNRYKGTLHRTSNSAEEWVMVENHHPAIFTAEEHEKMLALLEGNRRGIRKEGHNRITKNVYVFGRICYCGKCGSMLTSTSSHVQADGYRGSVYSCPKRTKTKDCDNPSMNDTVIGDFILNYVSNILRAKKGFSLINSPSELEASLLKGGAFRKVSCIEPSGLNELYNLLARFKSDRSFALLSKPSRKKAKEDPALASLRKDRERHERALKRLQELYLYSDKAMTETEYILQRAGILNAIEEADRKMGLKRESEGTAISDDDFIRKASHILISSALKDKEFIYYRGLASSVSPDVLKEYIDTIIDSIELTDGNVTAVTFRNGITNRFVYEKKGAGS